MFYCQPCATEREWPETMSQSYGMCEVCGKGAKCNDRPSHLLPMPGVAPDGVFTPRLAEMVRKLQRDVG